MPMYSIVQHCIVVCALFRISDQCSPVPQADDKILALRRALETAEKSSVEGRFVIGLNQPRLPIADSAAVCNRVPQLLTLIRARLGQTAVFSCQLDHCSCRNTTCPADVDEVLWRHNNCPVREELGNGYRSPFVYSQTRTSTTAYLFLHNVTFDAAGTMTCYCERRSDPGQGCINQAYELMPRLTPADVFETPVMNVTRPAGTNVTLLSKLRIRMTEHKDHRYIVRYNRRIVWVQATHPLYALKEAVFPDGGDLGLNEDNISMTIPYLPKSFSGQFEVWVRPYMVEDEFVVQTINLELT